MSTDVTASEQSLSAHVAEEIRALMARREINKTELARRLGVSDMWVGRRLRRQLPIDLEDLQRIAAVLGVSASDLLPKNTVWKTRAADGRVVATVGEDRKAKGLTPHRPHRPGRPVSQTRPAGQFTRPVTAIAVGR